MKDRFEIYKDIEIDPVGVFERHTKNDESWLHVLPDYMQGGVARYVVCGIKPGSFLLAVFSLEKEIAARRADTTNISCLTTWFGFVANECPADCFGSPDKVRAWVERGGLIGKE